MNTSDKLACKCKTRSTYQHKYKILTRRHAELHQFVLTIIVGVGVHLMLQSDLNAPEASQVSPFIFPSEKIVSVTAVCPIIACLLTHHIIWDYSKSHMVKWLCLHL